MTDKNQTVSAGKFGKKGLIVIVIVFISYFFGQALGNAGIANTVVPAMVELRGLDYNTITAWMTYAGWISIPFIILWARLGEKIGPKKVGMISLACAIVGTLLFGTAASNVQLIIGLLINFISLYGFFLYFGPALIANWFPQKRGIALGWATMGLVCVDIVWTPYIAKVIYALNPTVTFVIVAICIAVFIAAVAILVKDKPEDAGAFPDNIEHPDENVQLISKIDKVYKSDWTIPKLLRHKETWIVGIIGGILWMCGSGPIVTFYARMSGFGYEDLFISTAFQSVAVFSLFGSWLYGFIDVKLGTKKAYLLCGCIVFVGVLLMFFAAPVSKVGMYIGIVCLGSSIGGAPNLLASMQTCVWGRWDFSASNKIINPIAMIILNSNFLLISLSLSKLGNYNLFFAFLLILTAIAIVMILLFKVRSLGKSDEEVMQMYPPESFAQEQS